VPAGGSSIARRLAVGERFRWRARQEVIAVGSAVMRGVIGCSPARCAREGGRGGGWEPASGPAWIRPPDVGIGVSAGKRSPGESVRIRPVGGDGIRHLGVHAPIRPLGSRAGICPPGLGAGAGISPPYVGVGAGKRSIGSRARIRRAGAAAGIGSLRGSARI
jgi:hypothetical protein